MTIQQRIEDIAKRYGKGSWQENEAIELAKQIEEYGLNEYDYQPNKYNYNVSIYDNRASVIKNK